MSKDNEISKKIISLIEVIHFQKQWYMSGAYVIDDVNNYREKK